jgi:hypothetical protein
MAQTGRITGPWVSSDSTMLIADFEDLARHPG